MLTKEFNITMGANIPDAACRAYMIRTQKAKALLFYRRGFYVYQETAAQMLINEKVAYGPINYREGLNEVNAPNVVTGIQGTVCHCQSC